MIVANLTATQYIFKVLTIPNFSLIMLAYQCVCVWGGGGSYSLPLEKGYCRVVLVVVGWGGWR